MDESWILDDAEAKVSTKRAVLHGTTYSVANITSVKVEIMHPFQKPGFYLVFGGLVLIFIVPILGVPTMALGVVLAVLKRYVVKLGTAGMEQHGLVTKDQQRATAVAAALNEAITRR